MSLYQKYIEELLGDHVIETEHGFVTYRFTDDKTCYILNIYVLPEYRRHNFAYAMSDAVVAVAKKRGCNKLLGSVTPSAKGSTASLKVLLGYGMVLDSSAPDFILFKKELV